MRIRSRSSLECASALVAFGLLAACGQNNTYQAPPPPQVTVAKPIEQKITRYFEATGNTAAVNSANLVARVQGFLTEIAYTGLIDTHKALEAEFRVREDFDDRKNGSKAPAGAAAH